MLCETGSTRLRVTLLLSFILFNCFSNSSYADDYTTSKYQEEGVASWYGGKFQGRQTANGEIFDTYKFTAAHKTLPFDTMVTVVNLENNRQVQVRINDRGPFIPGRIIDLSWAAADRIGMIKTGIAKVRIVSDEIIMEREKKVDIQLASFRKRVNAVAFAKKLQESGFVPKIELKNGFVQVLLTNISQTDVDAILLALKDLGIDDPLVRTR